MEWVYRDFQQWPQKPTIGRRLSPFKDGWQQTADLLERELRCLQAKNVVIELDITAADIRVDGKLRAQVRPKTPGVIVSFSCKHGDLRYPCDTFTEWRDNLRAIALALEALRKVNRYGVGVRAEQYRGWTALPPPRDREFEDVASARDFIQRIIGYRVNWDDTHGRAAAIRFAEKNSHPDKTGGSAEQFKRVQAAREMIFNN